MVALSIKKHSKPKSMMKKSHELNKYKTLSIVCRPMHKKNEINGKFQRVGSILGTHFLIQVQSFYCKPPKTSANSNSQI